MFPIGDENSGRIRTPWVNYLLLALNLLAFVYWQRLGADLYFTFGYATVPAEILSGRDLITESKILLDPISGQRFEMPGLQPSPRPVYLTLLSSMFLHGGLGHILGNMLYLLVFGDNLENVMGHFRYLFFYLLTGMLAALTHVYATAVMGHNPLVPSLGASGAISAVLGGYLLLFPTNRVRVWFILGFWPFPAFLCVGLWFVFQIINGLGALGGDKGSGIAYAAHIGGFIAGMLLVYLFVRKNDLEMARRKRDWFRQKSRT